MSDVWLPLALIALLLYGMAQVAQKVSLRTISAPSMITLSLFVVAPIYFVCLSPYIVTGEILSMEPMAWLLGLLAAIFGQAGYYTYVEAAERGPISIVGSVTASYPIMVIVVAILFLNEAPTIIQLLGVMLITSSMIALTYFHGGGRGERSSTGGYFTICIVTVLLWGLWAVFTAMALDRMPSLMFLGIYAIIIVPTTVGYYRLKGLKAREVLPSWSVPLMIAVMSSEIGNIAFFSEVYAVSLGPASIVFPLVASSPIVVVLLAFAFLRERLAGREWFLIVLVIAGIIMVSTV